MQRIHGDISLLVYFPLDSTNIEMETDVKATRDMVALESPESDFLPTNNVDDAINMNLKVFPVTTNYQTISLRKLFLIWNKKMFTKSLLGNLTGRREKLTAFLP